MHAITSIEIENFRCFRRMSVAGLTRVNLIVGANNAGKTALLEAVEAVVSEASPYVLYRASLERGEFRQGRVRDEESVELDLRHWFHGHGADDGATFHIRAMGEHELSISRTVQRAPLDASPPFAPDALLLTIERLGKPALMPSLPLMEGGFLGAGAPRRFATFGLHLQPPVGFATTDRLFSAELARLWADVVLTPNEERTVEALRIVEPTIDRIAFSDVEGVASAKVLLRGADGPVPLGTLGEGVSRLLTIALNLAVTHGGFLLLDEVENGIHWSAMPKLWRFLVESACALDVQVFATTHSKDCLEGLANLHRSDPALAANVSVHRLEAGRERSIRFDAGRIAELVEMELEAR